MTPNLHDIDTFQLRFGRKAAYESAFEFMFEYISRIRTKLPALTAHAWEIVKRVRSGTASTEERDRIITEMWHYINRNESLVAPGPPDCCIMRPIMFLVKDTPREDEPVSEVVAWFLYFADKFEDHSADVAELVRRYFSSQPSAGRVLN